MRNATLDLAIRDHGKAALKLLQQLPNDDNSVTRQKLADAMQHLTQMRDGFIAKRRAKTNVDQFLARTNMILSTLFRGRVSRQGIRKEVGRRMHR